MSIQTINLDITPSNEPLQIVRCSQGDVGRQFKINLFDSGAAYTPPSGSTLEIVGKKSDKNIFQYNDNLNLSGSEVTVTLAEQMTTTGGPVTCELRILNGSSNVLGTANFILFCEGGIFDGNQSQSTVILLTQIEQDAADAVAAAAQAQQAVSDVETAAQNAEDNIDAALAEAQDTIANNVLYSQYYARTAKEAAQDAVNVLRPEIDTTQYMQQIFF